MLRLTIDYRFTNGARCPLSSGDWSSVAQSLPFPVLRRVLHWYKWSFASVANNSSRPARRCVCVCIREDDISRDQQRRLVRPSRPGGRRERMFSDRRAGKKIASEEATSAGRGNPLRAHAQCVRAPLDSARNATLAHSGHTDARTPTRSPQSQDRGYANSVFPPWARTTPVIWPRDLRALPRL